MLKIVIDATPITPQLSGVGFYVANLLHYLDCLQLQENFQLEIVYQPRFQKWLKGDLRLPESLQRYSKIRVLPLPVKISNLLLKTHYSPSLAYLKKYYHNPDIVHGTNYSVYPCKNSCKVMTIYDLSFIKYQEYSNAVAKNYFTQIKQCLQWTDLILTISESSKRDIIEYLQVDPKSIYVTPLASRYSGLLDQPDPELQKLVNYNFNLPYLLFVSTIEPRKNINLLVDAFNLLKQKYKIEHQLVLIGQKGWHYKPIFQKIQKSPWQHQIHHLDYLPDELVALFYTKADVFVYPSHYEGFGLPVLEAMTLGTPVVSANTSSLPEVAGDAAIMINPDDPVSLAEAILQVVSDSCLRHELVRKGKEQARLFSWEKTAKATLQAYRSLTV